MGQGIGILVSKLPKETAASYSLSDPAEVRISLSRPIGPKAIEQRINPRGSRNLMQALVTVTAN